MHVGVDGQGGGVRNQNVPGIRLVHDATER